jgi:glycosyltransferase involved in cell wall biosynthesis
VLGKIPVGEVSRYYKNASVFCMPTKREPFGLVFLEAMLYKLPVVATNIGAIPDFVTDNVNGYLVKSGNNAQLSASLIKLLDDPEKCRIFGEKGYNLVIEKYTWEKVGKRMKEHISKYVEN